MGRIAELADRPWLHLFPWLRCNLRCPYCSNPGEGSGTGGGNNGSPYDALEDAALLRRIRNLPPTHIYLSGGEPLLHPRIGEFVVLAGEAGHIVSFDTNFSLPFPHLETLFGAWKAEWLGFVNISHHLLCRIPLEALWQGIRILKARGIPHFVKYVGVPELLPRIREAMAVWRDRGVGTAVTILEGPWKGRRLPREYTLEEIRILLDTVTLNTHGFQVFGGVRSRGILCRGGSDFLSVNQTGSGRIVPCCHGGAFPLSLEHTFLGGGTPARRPCPVEHCLGDLMFIFGINGLARETERFEALVHGESEPVGIDSVTAFTRRLHERTGGLGDPDTFLRVERGILGKKQNAASRASSSDTAAHPAEPPASLDLFPPANTLEHLNAAELLEVLERIAGHWQDPEAVIRANPEFRKILEAEQRRRADYPPETAARALAKKLIQLRYGYPLKANFEISALCPLACGFCVLHDLAEHRRAPRMSRSDFQRIWRWMEICTTEVEFTGGEPLLNPDLFPMIRAARRSGVHTTVSTNGRLLDEKRIHALLESPPDVLLIAYDGLDPETYARSRRGGDLSRLQEGIGLLVHERRALGALRPRIRLQMVVSKQNVHQLDAFWKEARRRGADEACLKPVLVWPGAGAEYERKMIEEYLIPEHPFSYHRLDAHGNLIPKRAPGVCPNVQQVHIGSGSEVIPCWYHLKNTFVAGYAADTPFLDIWRSEAYRTYRRRMKEGAVHESCSGCPGIYDPALWVERRFR